MHVRARVFVRVCVCDWVSVCTACDKWLLLVLDFNQRVCVCVCVHVSVYMCVRACEQRVISRSFLAFNWCLRAHVCVCVCVRACVCTCMRLFVCVRACV